MEQSAEVPEVCSAEGVHHDVRSTGIWEEPKLSWADGVVVRVHLAEGLAHSSQRLQLQRIQQLS